MYELLGICLALAALLTFNALASVITAMLWRSVRRLAYRWQASTRAKVLFGLRVFPLSSAIVYVLMLLIPAYIAHEPRTTSEIVSPQLAVIAILSVVALVFALWRGFATWYTTRRLTIDWLRHAEPIKLYNVSIPAYSMRHRFPVIAVVGAIRPRLFIATQVLDSLNEEEIQAVMAHEQGHLIARDNLKRTIVRACRDVLMIAPCGNSLDREWTESSEAAADEHAAHVKGASGALDLASALLKIARMMPVGVRATLPAGAFLVGEEIGDVTSRVRRLAELASLEKIPEGRLALYPRIALWMSLCSLLAAAALIASYSHILIGMHTALECVVSALQ